MSKNFIFNSGHRAVVLDIQSVLDVETVNPLERTFQTCIGKEKLRERHPQEYPFRKARGLDSVTGFLKAGFGRGTKGDNPQLKAGAYPFLEKLTSLLDRETYFCAGNRASSFRVGRTDIQTDYFDPFLDAYREVVPESARGMVQSFSNTGVSQCDAEFTLFLTSDTETSKRLESQGYKVVVIEEKDFEGTLGQIKDFYENELPVTLPVEERMDSKSRQTRTPTDQP